MSAAEQMDPYDGRVLDAALSYAARGWRVVPIKRGAKSPVVNAWQNAATTDESIIRRWWTGVGRGNGVGIVTGEASGIWVLDVDVSAGKAGDDTLADLEAQYGALPDTVEAITGSGGRHIYFRWPGWNPGTNAGRLGPGLDVRAEGGQVLAAPTYHPSGTAYEWEAEHHPDVIGLADAPEWLLRLLAEAKPADTPRRETLTPYTGPERPGDRWMARTQYADLLERDGAVFLGRRQSRSHGEYELWARPGCQRDHGDLHTGATLWLTTGNLKVHTSEWPGLTSGENYSKLGYVAATTGTTIDAFVSGLRADEDRPLADIIEATRQVAAERPTPPAGDDEADDRIPGSWEPVDLRAIWEAGLDNVEQPTVLARSDGAGLMYRGRLNTIMGESGAGKSWAALVTVVQELESTDGHVLWLDWEDSAQGLMRRLLAIGVEPETIFTRFHYVQPDGPFDKTAKADIGSLVLIRGVTMVVIDSTGEALAGAGANPNSDDDVTKWFTALPRFLERRLKATVVLVDHVPKDQENAPRLHAIGSQRKRAAVTGTMLRVDVIEAYARGKAGRLKVTVAKDRHGSYPQGSVCAEIHVDGTEDGRKITITIEPPAARDESTGEVVRPTFLMERISRWLELNPGEHSGRTVETEVKGKASAKRQALRCLVDEGYVTASGGVRGSTMYATATTFREEADETASVIEATTSTASHRVPPRPDRVPGRGQTEESTASHRVPNPPYGGDAGDAVDGSDRTTKTTASPATASPRNRGKGTADRGDHGMSPNVSEPVEDLWG